MLSLFEHYSSIGSFSMQIDEIFVQEAKIDSKRGPAYAEKVY